MAFGISLGENIILNIATGQICFSEYFVTFILVWNYKSPV
jgi:hypothetical protein